MSDGFASLTETLRYATRHSPFYRALGPVSVLDQVPILDKTVLAERNLEFLCIEPVRVAEVVTTSGTTGRPLVWMLSERDLRRLALNEKLSFECAGVKPGELVLLAVTLDRAFMAGLAYWLGLQQLGCGVVRVGAAVPAMVLEMIERLRPTVVVGVPTFLRLVAEKAIATGLDLPGLGVRKLVCIGEPIRNLALELNRTGQFLEKAWGARVHSTYGVTELASSLCECEAGAGGHLHEELLHLEVLDEHGQPVAEGEVGEVVATPLGVEAMPILRYRTGDFAALYRTPCRCGRSSPRLGPIVGRRDQRLKVKGVSLFPSALQAVLEETPGVESYAVIARAEGDLADTLEVLVNGPVDLAVLREQFQARTKVSPGLRQASAAEIETLQLPPNARKRRWFVDLR